MAKAVLHDAGLGPGVPNIGHRAGEQRPGLVPISPVVIDYFADRPRPDRLDDRAGRTPLGRPIDRSAGLIAPSRVVINAVGRVGDHKVRCDATGSRESRRWILVPRYRRRYGGG